MRQRTAVPGGATRQRSDSVPDSLSGSPLLGTAGCVRALPSRVLSALVGAAPQNSLTQGLRIEDGGKF